MKFVLLFAISSFFFLQCAHAKSISPQTFSNLWETGNKFRLMRQQANSLNPASKDYKDQGFAVSYYITYNDFKVKEKNGVLDASIAGIKANFYGTYGFFDIGALDIQEVRGLNESYLNSSGYHRISTGLRYNFFDMLNLTTGLLSISSPAIKNDDTFVFNGNKTRNDLFISVSALGFQFMANTSNAENLIVETSSYNLSVKSMDFDIQRSKIYANGKKSSNKKYDTEYIISAYKNMLCNSSYQDQTYYCGVGITRNETTNDLSQSWSVYLKRPYYNINVNIFDELSELRRKNYGFAIKLGIDTLTKSINTDEKSKWFKESGSKVRAKVNVGIYMNDGANHLFSVQDEVMVGFDMEFSF